MPDDGGDGRTEEPRRRGGAHRKRKPPKQRSFWKELPILILVALLLTFTIQHFVARVYMIPSGSMQATLHGCPGCTPDRVLVDKVVYNFNEPEPGDVVVFHGPPAWTETDAPVTEPANPVAGFLQQVGSLIGMAPPDESDFVKRVVATGGQTVECCDDQNRVMVDGKPLDEPYLHWEQGRESEQRSFGPVEVPEDTLWMMGDNRNNSSDSRIQGTGGERGSVPVENVVGKARFIVLPPGRWGAVSDYNPQRE
ncbi:signal peptidase I [Haloechinothrix sp. LS1_15]|nr:signal peptidase I [Haloechinothrix sp. LS1_15]MDV6012805.1 signal peptidase I [Haloechinothrix sp. LS1_15]